MDEKKKNLQMHLAHLEITFALMCLKTHFLVFALYVHDLALGVGVCGPKCNLQCINIVYKGKRLILKGPTNQEIIKISYTFFMLYLFGLWQRNHVFKQKSCNTKPYGHLVSTGVKLRQNTVLTVH